MKTVRMMIIAALAVGAAACASMGGHPYGGADVGASGFADARPDASAHRG